MMWRRLILLLYCWAIYGWVLEARAAPVSTRPFRFSEDTFAYANELVWEYQVAPSTGRMTSHRRMPKPSYTLHCFVVSRSARQFFEHARFEPNEPKATSAVYRHLARQVMARSPRSTSPGQERIVIPGYSNLREFSAAEEDLLKATTGGAWQSYVQRGNWRMLFPFSRRREEQIAGQLVKSLEEGRPPLVHAVCFPELTLNHAVLLFDRKVTSQRIEFTAYDPNQPEQPIQLSFDRAQRRFFFPTTKYFVGGWVKVYEIYHAWNY
jgi:hypothetical protein